MNIPWEPKKSEKPKKVVINLWGGLQSAFVGNTKVSQKAKEIISDAYGGKQPQELSDYYAVGRTLSAVSKMPKYNHRNYD